MPLSTLSILSNNSFFIHLNAQIKNEPTFFLSDIIFIVHGLSLWCSYMLTHL